MYSLTAVIGHYQHLLVGQLNDVYQNSEMRNSECLYSLTVSKLNSV